MRKFDTVRWRLDDVILWLDIRRGYYHVLIDNGFTPEWIMLQKEIRQEKNDLKRNLYKERTYFAEYPLDGTELYKWQRLLEKYKIKADEINKKIVKYNLVVPALQTQFLQFSLDKEAEKILKYGETKREYARKHKKPDDAQENPQNIFSFIESFIRK